VGDGLQSTTINLQINTRGHYRPAWKALKVTLPAGEKRKLLINGRSRRMAAEVTPEPFPVGRGC
jgi:hypothetical protein